MKFHLSEGGLKYIFHIVLQNVDLQPQTIKETVLGDVGKNASYEVMYFMNSFKHR